jgi:hypothetical protein
LAGVFIPAKTGRQRLVSQAGNNNEVVPIDLCFPFVPTIILVGQGKPCSSIFFSALVWFDGRCI